MPGRMDQAMDERFSVHFAIFRVSNWIMIIFPSSIFVVFIFIVVADGNVVVVAADAVANVVVAVLAAVQFFCYCSI